MARIRSGRRTVVADGRCRFVNDRSGKSGLVVALVLALTVAPALSLVAAAPVRAEGSDPARVATAIGRAAFLAAGGWHETVTVESGGQTGTVDRWIDPVGGRFVERRDVGARHLARGWDGTSLWTLSGGGPAHSDSDPVAIDEARWTLIRLEQGLPPDAHGTSSPDRLVVVGRSDGAAAGAETGAVTIQLDPATGRPQALQAGEGRAAWIEGWRAVGAAWIPTVVRLSAGPDAAPVIERVSRIDPVGVLADERFAAPTPLMDWQFPADTDRVDLACDLVGDHIRVQGRIDDGAPLALLLDTGAVDLLNDRTARRLRLDPIATETASGGIVAGAGEAETALGLIGAHRLALGGAALIDPVIPTADLAPLAASDGRPIDGLIGYEWFSRFVIRIDYARHRVTLFKPGAAAAPAGSIALPFRFAGQIPEVRGHLDRWDGWIQLDTGSRGGITLFQPFVEATDLVTRYQAQGPVVIGHGLGGLAHAHLAAARPVRLGSLAVPVAALALADQHQGVFAQRGAIASLGGAVLRQFTVTFDYHRQTVWLQPNSLYGAPTPPDRSGLWLDRDGDAIRVVEVAAGSPAAGLGLAPGAILLAVDGKPVAGEGLPTLRQRLRRPPGTTIALDWLTGSGRRHGWLRLAGL